MRAQAGAAAAVHHVDRGHLAHGLQEDAVQLGQQLRHQLGALGRGRDRVAEEVAAAGEQRADRRGVGALEDEGAHGQGGSTTRCPGTASRPRGATRVAAASTRSSASPGSRQQAVRLRAGVEAQAAGRAVLEVERRRAMRPVSGWISDPSSMQWWAQAAMQRPQPLQYSGTRIGFTRSRAPAMDPLALSPGCKRPARRGRRAQRTIPRKTGRLAASGGFVPSGFPAGRAPARKTVASLDDSFAGHDAAPAVAPRLHLGARGGRRMPYRIVEARRLGAHPHATRGGSAARGAQAAGRALRHRAAGRDRGAHPAHDRRLAPRTTDHPDRPGGRQDHESAGGTTDRGRHRGRPRPPGQPHAHRAPTASVACVGGGVGAAELLPIAGRCTAAGNAVHAILGARSRGPGDPRGGDGRLLGQPRRHHRRRQPGPARGW